MFGIGQCRADSEFEFGSRNIKGDLKGKCQEVTLNKPAIVGRNLAWEAKLEITAQNAEYILIYSYLGISNTIHMLSYTLY